MQRRMTQRPAAEPRDTTEDRLFASRHVNVVAPAAFQLADAQGKPRATVEQTDELAVERVDLASQMAYSG